MLLIGNGRVCTRACAWATYLDCIRNGVTTIFDHHASFCEIPGSLFAIEEVAKQAGVRSCLCYEVSERDGEEKCGQAIRENADDHPGPLHPRLSRRDGHHPGDRHALPQ